MAVYRDEQTLDKHHPANKNNDISFKFKGKITGHTGNGSTKDFEIMVYFLENT